MMGKGLITPLKALTEFFQDGDGKRPMRDWAAEVKALSPAEKTELATEAAVALGYDGLVV
jgi:hypothetical protein